MTRFWNKQVLKPNNLKVFVSKKTGYKGVDSLHFNFICLYIYIYIYIYICVCIPIGNISSVSIELISQDEYTTYPIFSFPNLVDTELFYTGTF
jgi:hypothetical protein